MLYERLRNYAFEQTKRISMVNGDKKKYLKDLEKLSKTFTKIVKSDCTKSPYTAKQYFEQFHENFETDLQETVFSKSEIAKRKIIHNASVEATVEFAKQDFMYSRAFLEAKGDFVIYRTAECLLEMADTPEEMMTVVGYIKQDRNAVNPETGRTYDEDINNYFVGRIEKAKSVIMELSTVHDPMEMIEAYKKYGRILNGFSELGKGILESLERELNIKIPQDVLDEWNQHFQNSAMALSGFKNQIYAQANPLFPEFDIQDAKQIDFDMIGVDKGRATVDEIKLFHYDSIGGVTSDATIFPPKGYYSNPYQGLAKSASVLPTIKRGASLDTIEPISVKQMKDNAEISLKFIARRFNKNYTIDNITLRNDNPDQLQNCTIKDKEGNILDIKMAALQLVEGNKLFLHDPHGHLLTDLTCDRNNMLGFLQTSARPEKFKFKEMAEKHEKTAVEKADKKFNEKMEKEVRRAQKKVNDPEAKRAVAQRVRDEYTKKHDALVRSELEKNSNKELKANLKEMYKAFTKLQSKRTGDPQNDTYNTLTNKLKEAMNCNFSNKTELVEKLNSVRNYAQDYLTDHISSDVQKGSNLEGRLQNAQTALTSFQLIQEKVNDFAKISDKYLPLEERPDYVQQQAMERQNFVQGMERDLNANEIQINNQLDPNEISTSRNLVINPPIADNEDGRQTEQEVPQINEPGDRFEL